MLLKLVKKEELPGGIISFVFEPDTPVSWQPGQYMHYTLDHPNSDERGIERWFTIASPTYEKNVRITTRYADGLQSSFKQALQKLVVGQAIEVDEPEGDFVIDDLTKKYILIAGGIGITPFYAILKQLEYEGKSINADLIYLNRDENMIFLDEFNLMKKKNTSLCVHAYPGDKRLADDELSGFKDVSEAYVYVSGPKSMVGYYRDKLQELGLPKERLKVDFFPGYPNY